MGDMTHSERPAPDSPEEVTKKVYKLKIHERTADVYGYTITRVPGGWIYDRSKGSVFVPYYAASDPDRIEL